MITKYFCDCGKELTFVQKDACFNPWATCNCGKNYYQSWCQTCGSKHVGEVRIETMQQHLERWSAS
jgi:hypothetical protein